MTLTNYGTPVVGIEEDIPDLLALRTQIEEWLADRSIEQWGPGELPEDVITVQVADREWYVLRREGRLVAALRVLWSDPDLAEDAEVDADGEVDADDAIFVDTIMVDRAWSGGDVGAALLEWAGALGAFGERDWLRVDCRADNEQLAGYYEGLGFVRVDAAEQVDPVPGASRDPAVDRILLQRHT